VQRYIAVLAIKLILADLTEKMALCASPEKPKIPAQKTHLIPKNVGCQSGLFLFP
jgi:hypothetical protein